MKVFKKRALRYIHDDYDSDYDNDTLLLKSKLCTMEIRRLGSVAMKIFKTINNLNPSFMKELFVMRKGSYKRKYDLCIPTRNTVSFGDNSIKTLGPHIWKTLKQRLLIKLLKNLSIHGLDQNVNVVCVYF